MSEFIQFSRIIDDNLKKAYASNKVFRAEVSRDTLWDTYLDSFAPGTNPIFRERTEHDCNCCKHFVKNIGNLVWLDENNNRHTIWEGVEGTIFEPVAGALHTMVLAAPVDNQFKVSQRHYVFGSKPNHDNHSPQIVWDHFYTEVPTAYRVSELETALGATKTQITTLARTFNMISADAVRTVRDLIKDGMLYRGETNTTKLDALWSLHILQTQRFVTDYDIALVAKQLGSSSNIRGSAIGTLLSDLSDGVDLETAVSAYEKVVAPENYKRSKSLITQAMIDKAEATLESLDLVDALHRRHATLADITVNNVLFADRAIKKPTGALSGLISANAPTDVSKKPHTDISISDFLEKVLPEADSISALVERRHMGNLVNLVAPETETTHLLKWNNDFSYSYNGGYTDAIKQRVKNAGGNVEGCLRISMAWEAAHDYDLSVILPDKNEVNFSTRIWPKYGVHLDVDANAHRIVQNPVENIIFSNINTLKPGKYVVRANNYRRRNTSRDNAVTFQIETSDGVHETTLPGLEKAHTRIATITVDREKNITVDMKGAEQGLTPHAEWNVQLNTYLPVQAIMDSPNHWDGQKVGDKHTFFLIQNMRNPEPVRSLYTEFLHNELHPHRKVFEHLGSKLLVDYSEDQLAGVGFIRTARNNLKVQVKTGSRNRYYNIQF